MKGEWQSVLASRLNERVLTRLAPSPIHGIGVFALRDIPKGTRLNADMRPEVYALKYENFPQLHPEVRANILERWPTVVTGSAFAYPDTRIQAFMNHADEPNYDNLTDRTLRDIKAGEEITEDYRNIQGAEQVFTWLSTPTT